MDSYFKAEVMEVRIQELNIVINIKIRVSIRQRRNLHMDFKKEILIRLPNDLVR